MTTEATAGELEPPAVDPRPVSAILAELLGPMPGRQKLLALDYIRRAERLLRLPADELLEQQPRGTT